ncbi:hypothetical protein AMATHDRAFT_6796 [Amanita thiersii Skay4041]|uniref:Uncharacterized protein n=1 Tax=Amanita thiersii Skay4041 TaxID=703135 RepID=A0A2A9NI67_9AGAR|nr:hypothetical protein AMATHDRAFT_6796 [Amanita thiersii Skay4041]
MLDIVWKVAKRLGTQPGNLSLGVLRHTVGRKLGTIYLDRPSEYYLIPYSKKSSSNREIIRPTKPQELLQYGLKINGICNSSKIRRGGLCPRSTDGIKSTGPSTFKSFSTTNTPGLQQKAQALPVIVQDSQLDDEGSDMARMKRARIMQYEIEQAQLHTFEDDEGLDPTRTTPMASSATSTPVGTSSAPTTMKAPTAAPAPAGATLAAPTAPSNASTSTAGPSSAVHAGTLFDGEQTPLPPRIRLRLSTSAVADALTMPSLPLPGKGKKEKASREGVRKSSRSKY